MNRTLTYTVSSSENNLRVEQFLRRRGFSSKLLTRLRQSLDYVYINNIPVPTIAILKQNDLLTVILPEEESSEKIPPVKLPVSILYEDEDILVVNKPAGMPIHPSMDNYYNSLANGLAWYYQAKGDSFVFRCTNRLDRDTSGVTVVAKNALSSAILSEMGAKHQLQREYYAIVKGHLSPITGTITAPLARVGNSIIQREVNYCIGEEAVTHYQVLKHLPEISHIETCFGNDSDSCTSCCPSAGNDTPADFCTKKGYSLVSLLLETGRTHQIRVHMKYIGHPLIGDYLYNPDMRLISRQALHSRRMTFFHPVTGKLLSFTAPLPQDMQFIVQL